MEYEVMLKCPLVANIAKVYNLKNIYTVSKRDLTSQTENKLFLINLRSGREPMF